MKDAILAVNAGSSSLKFALYPRVGQSIDPAGLSGLIEGLEAGGTPKVRITASEGSAVLPLATGGTDRFADALHTLDWILRREAGDIRINAVAHRIVHGGDRMSASVLLDDDAIAYLDSLSPLAPLHQPHNLAGVRAFRRSFPTLPQIGCFDTAFHASLPQVERMFALPQELRASGIRRYGFHGLSYQYVSQALLARSARAQGCMLVAHLGNGASACAIRNGKSIATTMGFSALDGLMMGTRCGALDPGVILHLLREGWDAERLEKMLYRECGLRGVSGLSADMRALLASESPDAQAAIALFTHRVVREAGALSACLGGVDLLAFTGGIGEHDAGLRERVCQALGYLGVEIDAAANRAASGDSMVPLHTSGSSVEIWVVPTDEGRVAAADAARLL